MSLAQGIHATYPDATANSPHIFDFTVARSAANDDLLEIWNGSTVAAIKAAIDKDGYLYSAAATAGDVPYFVTGGISNVRKMDYLNIGAANRVMTSSGTVPQWVTALTGLTSLGVDNLLVDGNTISSTSGALNLTPLAGQAIVLDEAINVDAGVVTGATSITSTAMLTDLITSIADAGVTLELDAGGAALVDSTSRLNVSNGLIAFTNASNVILNLSGQYILYPETNDSLNLGDITHAFKSLFLGAASTSKASLNVPHGTAPTSPVDGDIWTTTAGLYVRVNGSTIGPLS